MSDTTQEAPAGDALRQPRRCGAVLDSPTPRNGPTSPQIVTQRRKRTSGAFAVTMPMTGGRVIALWGKR